MVAAAGWLGAVMAGCPAPAAAQSETVQIVKDRAALAGCDALGEVKGSSFLGRLLSDPASGMVMDEMKEKALAIGATHILLGEVQSGWIGTNAWGQAFACPLEPRTAPPQPQRPRRGR